MSRTLLQWLQSAGLESLHERFVEYQVAAHNIANLQFTDYDQMGIVEPPLRQKLFRLVQTVKREQQQQQQQGAAPSAQPSAPASQASNASLAPTQVLPSRAQVVQQPQSQPPPQQPPPSVHLPRATKPAAAPAASLLSKPSRSTREAPPPEPEPVQAPAPQQRSNRRASVQPAPAAPQPVARREPEPQPIDEDEEAAAVGGEDEDGEDEDPDVEASGYVDDIPKIRVAVRKRPINSKERANGENDVAIVDHRTGAQVTIHEPKQKVDLTKYVESHKFTFDEVFGDDSTNEEIYNGTCKQLVQFFIHKGRGHASCFAYGQTGSGKTFTMLGDNSGPGIGLYAMAARDMFRTLNSNEKFSELQVFISYFEIHNGKLFDLLNDRQKLVMREDGQRNVNIVGLRERRCATVSDVLELMTYGNAVRSTGSTGANVDSSRSHAILQIVLKKPSKVAPAYPGAPAKQKLKMHGKFSFIDLAGSERGADTSNNDRRTRLEGAEINKSLLALKECIRALDQGGKHLPFRGSQLTQVLKDSFTGNSKTVMIANISPNSGSCEHSLNTLRYADRVKELKRGAGAAAAPGGVKGYDAYMPHQGKQGRRTYEDGSNDGGTAFITPPAPVAAAAPVQLPPQVQKQPSVSGIPKPGSNNAGGGGGRSSLSGQDSNAAPSSKPFVKPLASALKSNAAASASPIDDDAAQDDLKQTHTDLCSTILREEESIVEAHRGQIDSTMRGVKEEMELLKKFDTTGINVDDYVDRLDDLLTKKMNGIHELKSKLQLFKKHLKQEEELSSSFNRKVAKMNNGNGTDPWGRPAGYEYDDDQAPPPQQPPQGRHSGQSRDPSYPHLAPLPGTNYNR